MICKLCAIALTRFQTTFGIANSTCVSPNNISFSEARCIDISQLSTTITCCSTCCSCNFTIFNFCQRSYVFSNLQISEFNDTISACITSHICQSSRDALTHLLTHTRQLGNSTCSACTRNIVRILRDSNSSQNTDNRNNDHQFDQGKTFLQSCFHLKLLINKK